MVRRMLVTTLTTACLALSSVTVMAQAAESIGWASIVTGKVQVLRAGQREWVTLKPGDALFQGDKLRTGSPGAARLTFNDSSHVNLVSNSEIELNEFVFTPGKSRRSFFKLWSGKLKARITKYFLSENKVEFGTPTAVAGVRGTELLVSEQEVICFTGLCAVRAASGRGREYPLEPGQGSIIGPDGLPQAPRTLDERQLRLAMRIARVTDQGLANNVVSNEDAEEMSVGVDTGGHVEHALAKHHALPPIHQQPTDVHEHPTLTIHIKLPGGK